MHSLKYLGTFFLILCLTGCGKPETMYTIEQLDYAFTLGMSYGAQGCKKLNKGDI